MNTARSGNAGFQDHVDLHEAAGRWLWMTDSGHSKQHNVVYCDPGVLTTCDPPSPPGQRRLVSLCGGHVALHRTTSAERDTADTTAFGLEFEGWTLRSLAQGHNVISPAGLSHWNGNMTR